MQIEYEDNHILIASKPGGLCTQGDDGFEGALKRLIKKRDAKPGNVYLHAVHRLDKPVSGLVLFAKTSKALSRLQQAMRDRQITRKYVARVEGTLTGSGNWSFFHIKKEYRAEISSEPVGKPIKMAYEASGNRVCITLETGRYHQIRAVLGYIGHPILGDAKYGAQTKQDAIALTCCYIVLTHPTTKEVITVDLVSSLL